MVGRRDTFTAVVRTFGHMNHERHRIPATLLVNIHCGDRFLCDHVWIMGHLSKSLCNKTIEFSALVIPYRRKGGSVDYKLSDLSDIQIYSGAREEKVKGEI